MNPQRKILSILAGAILSCAHSTVPAQSTGRMSGQDAAQSGAQSSAQQTQQPQQSDSGTMSSGASGTGAASSGSATVTVPMLVLVPVEIQSEANKLNNGCWVRLIDKDAMPKQGNDILTIVRKMYIPSFETPSGINWSHKADGLVVGPKATVMVYADKNFKGKVAKLSAGQQVKDINKDLGFPQSIDSMKVDCAA